MNTNTVKGRTSNKNIKPGYYARYNLVYDLEIKGGGTVYVLIYTEPNFNFYFIHKLKRSISVAFKLKNCFNCRNVVNSTLPCLWCKNKCKYTNFEPVEE